MNPQGYKRTMPPMVEGGKLSRFSTHYALEDIPMTHIKPPRLARDYLRSSTSMSDRISRHPRGRLGTTGMYKERDHNGAPMAGPDLYMLASRDARRKSPARQNNFSDIAGRFPRTPRTAYQPAVAAPDPYRTSDRNPWRNSGGALQFSQPHRRPLPKSTGNTGWMDTGRLSFGRQFNKDYAKY